MRQNIHGKRVSSLLLISWVALFGVGIVGAKVYADYSQRQYIQKLQTDLEQQIQSTQTQFNQQVSTLSGNVSSVQKSLQQIQEDVKAKDKTNSDLSSQIGEVKNQLTLIQKSLDAVQ